ncbi:hypothetical protein NDU88_004607 [Pleurodeles waltl]|uniref:Uncharacterized protein n=1 Tax=Pleurodeles waltl TaxID=8319 RepID=A0AAV7TRZ1_PLEWA|nr:hypothetical protein NDU88_004607 [Pleurodeles waltl]
MVILPRVDSEQNALNLNMRDLARAVLNQEREQHELRFCFHGHARHTIARAALNNQQREPEPTLFLFPWARTAYVTRQCRDNKEVVMHIRNLVVRRHHGNATVPV